MKNAVRSTILALAAASMTLIASAQDPIGGDSYGSGTYRFSSKTSGRLDRIQTRFDRNGTFYLMVPGKGQIKGSWYDRGRNSLDVRITDVPGNSRVSGSGTITLDNRDMVQSVSISGRGRDGDFNIRFDQRGRQQGGGRDGGRGGGRDYDFSFTSRDDGSGNYRRDNRDYDLRDASVSLNKDGKFKINIGGERKEMFQGTYDMRGNQAILHITSGFGQSNIDGDGTVNLTTDRRDYTAFSFNARNRNVRVSGEFRPESWNRGDDKGIPGRPYPGRPDPDRGWQMYANERGGGSYTIRGDKYDVESVSLNLMENGTFTLAFPYQRTTQRFSGTYTRRGNSVELTLTGGFGNNIRGRGTAALDGDRSFSTLNFSGDDGGVRFSFGFRK